MNAFFTFYGIQVQIQTDDKKFEPILQHLTEDFEYFLTPPPTQPGDQPKIILTLTTSLLSNWRPLAKKRFSTKMCEVYDLGMTRICDYSSGMIMTSQTIRNLRTLFVRGHPSNAFEIYEIAYTTVISSIGEELDLLGFHRVHALAIRNQQRSALILLPSGKGKSAMASLLKDKGFSIFSDEMPLVKNGVLYPFPIRIALDPGVAQALSIDVSHLRIFKRRIYPEKALIPIERNLVATPTAASCVMYGKCSHRKPTIRRTNRPSLGIQLFFSLVVGLGLCQMSELMLRPGNLIRLLKITTSRFREMLILICQSKPFIFNVSKNAEINSKALALFMGNNPVKEAKSDQTTTLEA